MSLGVDLLAGRHQSLLQGAKGNAKKGWRDSALIKQRPFEIEKTPFWRLFLFLAFFVAFFARGTA